MNELWTYFTSAWTTSSSGSTIRRLKTLWSLDSIFTPKLRDENKVKVPRTPLATLPALITNEAPTVADKDGRVSYCNIDKTQILNVLQRFCSSTTSAKLLISKIFFYYFYNKEEKTFALPELGIRVRNEETNHYFSKLLLSCKCGIDIESGFVFKSTRSRRV